MFTTTQLPGYTSDSIITLSSNSPTLDPDQHSHHCIANQADTTRTYRTLLLKLDWAKQRISKSYKRTPVQKQTAQQLLKESKITFSIEIVVDQDKLIFHPQASAPPIFRVKTNPSPFNCHGIPYKFDSYTKNTEGFFVFYNPDSGLSYTCPLQI